jgi:hypothetical protein
VLIDSTIVIKRAINSSSEVKNIIESLFFPKRGALDALYEDISTIT